MIAWERSTHSPIRHTVLHRGATVSFTHRFLIFVVATTFLHGHNSSFGPRPPPAPRPLISRFFSQFFNQSLSRFFSQSCIVCLSYSVSTASESCSKPPSPPSHRRLQASPPSLPLVPIRNRSPVIPASPLSFLAYHRSLTSRCRTRPTSVKAATYRLVHGGTPNGLG